MFNSNESGVVPYENKRLAFLSIALVAALLCISAYGFQRVPASQRVGLVSQPAGGADSNLGFERSKFAPNAIPKPINWSKINQFVGVMIAGMISNYFRLWRRFRRFLSLGALTNWFAIVYIVWGAVPSIFNLLAGFLHFTSSNLAWALGGAVIVSVSIAHYLESRKRIAPTGANDIESLGITTTRFVIYTIVEDGILSTLRRNLQREITKMSLAHDWPTIKIAFERALNEEQIFKRLVQKNR